MTPSAVLFDCDGVIVDSEGPTFTLVIADLAAHGLPLTRHQLETDFIGGTIEQLADRARARGASLPETWVQDFYARLYRILETESPLMPGVTEVFDRLDAAGIPFAVASNGTAEKMRISLGQKGLLPRFRAVLSGQEIGRPKPLPDIYLMAASACGAAPQDCVVIEDSPAGARAAIAAGIRCLGYAPQGPDTPPAQGLTVLGVPLFDDMAQLPGLLGL